MKNKSRWTAAGLLSLMVGLAGCGTLELRWVTPAAGTGGTPSTAPTATPSPLGFESAGWKTYLNRVFSFSFEYPAGWPEPTTSIVDVAGEDRRLEIYLESTRRATEGPIESEGGYPESSVVLSIAFLENESGKSILDLASRDRRIEAFTDLSLIADNENTILHKLQFTRIGEASAGSFRGLEFTAASPANAQAEIYFDHNAVLVDSRTRVLVLTYYVRASADMLGAGWREAYAAADAKYRDLFLRILSSIQVP